MSSALFSYISLDDWQLIKVSGDDNEKYLQGQVTAEMRLLNDQRAIFAAHCDTKGKMWSNMLLFKRDNDIFYIVRKSVAQQQILELKKYAIFSKVTIELVNDLKMIGLIGEINSSILAQLGKNNCITHLNTTYITLLLPEKRMIMISPDPLPENQLPSMEWLKLDLLAGYPIIDHENIQSLLPQACNLQTLDAISFEKGCYVGQEMVARAQFRGANKRGMYLLSGTANLLPIIGDSIECQIGEHWRETGQILAAYKQTEANGTATTYIQVILNNDVDIDTRFRLKGQEKSQLSFH